MLSLERNDSTSRCAWGGEGNAAAIEFGRKNSQYKTDLASIVRQCLLIQRPPKLSGEADQLCHSRQQNITPVAGRVTPPWRSSAQQLDGLGGCSSQLPRSSAEHWGGRASFAQQQPLYPCCTCCSQRAASCSSCHFEGMVRQILWLRETAAELQKKKKTPM